MGDSEDVFLAEQSSEKNFFIFAKKSLSASKLLLATAAERLFRFAVA